MCEVAVVEEAKPLSVVDGFAHHYHGGQREVIVLEQRCQFFELSAVDALVGPREAVARRHRSVRRIATLQELLLHLVDDAGTEEDAHGRLMGGEEL